MLPHFCYQHFAGVTVCVTRIDDICGQKQWKSDEFRVPTATLGMCRVKLLSYLGGFLTGELVMAAADIFL